MKLEDGWTDDCGKMTPECKGSKLLLYAALYVQGVH